MKIASIIGSIIAVAAAAADPQVTARAELAPRQNSDPAFLGYISSGSAFSDARSCDYPQTLSRQDNYAQCCSGNSCVFWTACSAGTLFASQTSLFCDQGYCNTAVIQPSIGASAGQSYLGCWATSLGQQPFTIVANVGSAPIAQATPSASASSGGSSARSTSGASTTTPSSAPSATSSSASPSQAPQSTGAAVHVAGHPLTGVFGLIAMVLGMF